MHGQACRANSYNTSDFRDWVFWVSLDGACLMGIPKAFGDASRRNDGTRAVAACLFSKKQSKRFAAEMDHHFGKYGGLHMRKLVHGYGAFEPLSESEREVLRRVAEEIVCSRVETCVVVGCAEQDAEGLILENEGYVSPYAICCHWVALGLSEWCESNGRRDLIHYTFEAGDRGGGEASKYFEFWAKHKGLSADIRYAGHDFVTKSVGGALLQAADLIAWEAGIYMSECMTTEGEVFAKSTGRPERPSFLRLADRLEYGSGLGSRLRIVKLPRAILRAEQASIARDGRAYDDEQIEKEKLRQANIKLHEGDYRE